MMMSDRPPSDTPILGEKEVRDWHPDEQNEYDPENLLTFSTEQSNALQTYIWKIRDMLGLQTWDVYLTAAPSSDDCNASIHPVYGRHSAGLSVNKNWYSLSPEVQRNTIIHELLHVAHNRQTEVIRTTKQRDEVWVTFERETELMVDHLATALEDLFPLPDRTLFEQVMDDLDSLDRASDD